MKRNINSTLLLALLLVFTACGQKQEQTQQNKGSRPDPEVTVELDAVPIPTKQVQPVYPKEAIQGNVQGDVMIQALVSAEGKVDETQISRNDTGSPELAKSAEDAVKQWTFKPGMKGDKPVAAWVMIPVRFKLNDKKK